MANYRIDLFKKTLVPIAGEAVTLTNTAFASNLDNWTIYPQGATEWVQSAGTAYHVGGATNRVLYQAFEDYLPTAGVWYDLTFDLIVHQGKLEAKVGSFTGGTNSAQGEFDASSAITLTFLAGQGVNSSDYVSFTSKLDVLDPFIGSVDNVFVRRNIELSPVGTKEQYDAFKSIELKDDVDIPLNYSINSIADFGNVNSNFSKTIAVPSTPINDSVFASIWNVNSTFETFDPRKKFRAILYSDDTAQFDGFIQLLEVENQGSELSYNVKLFSDSRNFFELMGDTELQELEWNELNHKFTWNKLNEVWTGNTEWTSGYYYPRLYSPNGEYDIKEFYPAVYYKYAIDKIAEKFGYRLNISPSLNDVWNRMIIPYAGDRLTLSDQEKYDFSVYAGLNSDETTLTQGVVNLPIQISAYVVTNNDLSLSNLSDPFYEGAGSDGLGVWESNGGAWTFTAPASGEYAVDFVLSGAINYTNSFNLATSNDQYQQESDLLTPAIGQSRIEANLRIDGQYNGASFSVPQDDFLHVVGATKYLPIGNFAGQGDQSFILSGAATLTLQIGQTVNLQLKNINNNRFTDFVSFGSPKGGIPNQDVVIYQDGSFFRTLSKDNPVGEDNKIDFTRWIPQIKCKDLFNNLQKMFNLYMYANEDEPNKLNIVSRDEYYSGATILDWSLKLDRDSKQEISLFRELTDREITLTYADSDDYFNNLYKGKNSNNLYGLYRKEFESDFVDDGSSIELDFSPTPIVESNTGSYLPAIDSVEVGDELRVLLLHNSSLNDDFIVLRKNDNDPSTQLESAVNFYYPALHINSITAPTVDINYGNVGRGILSNPIALPNNNLYNRYWKSSLDLIEQGRILTAYFYLTSRDIQLLKDDLSYKIWIADDETSRGGSYYLISRVIDYNPTYTELTKVELIKLDEVSSSLYELQSTGGNDSSVPSDPQSPNSPTGGGGSTPVVISLPKDAFPVPIGGGDANEYIIRKGEILPSHNNNKNDSPNALILGKKNVVQERNGKGNMIVGDQNRLGGNSKEVIVVGSGNTVDSGAEKVFLFGSDDQVVGSTQGYFNALDKLIIEGNDTIISTNLILSGGTIEGANFSGSVIPASSVTGGTDYDIFISSGGILTPSDFLVLDIASQNISLPKGTDRILSSTKSFTIGADAGEISICSKSGLIGGEGNLIDDALRGIIVGGIGNILFNKSDGSTIIGGSENTISGSSQYNLNLGGFQNLIHSASTCSQAIGASGVTIEGNYISVIGLQSGTYSEKSTVYVPQLNIHLSANTFADHAAADASSLTSGGVYQLSGDRTLYRKP